MKIQIDEPWRGRLVDALDRLSARYPSCIGRDRGAAWTWAGPCSHCGGPDFLITVA